LGAASLPVFGEGMLILSLPVNTHTKMLGILRQLLAAVLSVSFTVRELRGYVASLRPAARKQLQKLLYVSS
jgi:hypothetical protein